MSKPIRKFWNWIKNDAGENILRLEGPIDSDNFWGDAVTPQQFREELDAIEGDVTIWINSPGGNVFAAAEIYTMLCDHKGSITVKIDAIAASAASVIAMAGDRVLMSPVGMILIHDPMTIAMGNTADMEKAIDTLNEVKESIINAYCRKTGLSRNKVSKLMSDETWMSARKAVELGFVDEILFDKDSKSGGETGSDKGEGADDKEIEAVWKPYSTKAMGQRVLNWLLPANADTAGTDEEPDEHACDKEDMEQAKARVVFDRADGEGAVSDNESTSEAGGEDTNTAEPEAYVVDDKKSSSKDGSGGNGEESKEDDPDGDSDGDDSKNGSEGDSKGGSKNDSKGDSKKDSKEDSKDCSEKDKPDDDPDSDSDADDADEDSDDPDEDDPDTPKKPSPSKQKGTDESKEDSVKSSKPTYRPTVGYDGKTEDGAMPYELLKKQLDCLR